MGTATDITSEMDALEEDAARVLANPALTPLERRMVLDRLLHRYRVQEEYRAALAAFIRGMRNQNRGRSPAPEAVVREILDSPEFACLRLVVLATLVAVVYGDGPRATWVPVALLPTLTLPVPGLRL